MAPARSVLLDLDGLLVDSQPGIFASCLAALRALGHNPSEALDTKRAIGLRLEDMLQAFAAGTRRRPNLRRAAGIAASWIANLLSHIEA